MLEIDVSTMIWGICMSATIKAAVHLGQYYQENLHSTKNTEFENVKQLFDLSQKSILDQSQEIYWISRLECNSLDENHFVERQSSEAVDSKGKRLL